MNNQVRIAKITAKYLTRHGIRFANEEDVERFFVKSTQILKKQATSKTEDPEAPSPKEITKVQKRIESKALVNKTRALEKIEEDFKKILEDLEVFGISMYPISPLSLGAMTFVYQGYKYSFREFKNLFLGKKDPTSKKILVILNALLFVNMTAVQMEKEEIPKKEIREVMGESGRFFEKLAELLNFDVAPIAFAFLGIGALVGSFYAFTFAAGFAMSNPVLAFLASKSIFVAGTTFGIGLGAIATGLVVLGRDFLIWLARKTGNLFSSMGFKFAGQRSAMYRQTARALYYAQ